MEESLPVYRGVNPLELASALAADTGRVPAGVPAESGRRAGPMAVPTGPGSNGADQLVFREDICGRDEMQPRHARAHATPRNMRAEFAAGTAPRPAFVA